MALFTRSAIYACQTPRPDESPIWTQCLSNVSYLCYLLWWYALPRATLTSLALRVSRYLHLIQETTLNCTPWFHTIPVTTCAKKENISVSRLVRKGPFSKTKWHNTKTMRNQKNHKEQKFHEEQFWGQLLKNQRWDETANVRSWKSMFWVEITNSSGSSTELKKVLLEGGI